MSPRLPTILALCCLSLGASLAPSTAEAARKKGGGAAETAADPVDARQAQLDQWWVAAADYWLGETVYEVAPRSYDDGLCSVQLSSGYAVPVWSGRLPVQPRIVGFVFVGEGGVDLSFPERADAWRFGNHQALHDGLDRGRLDAIAAQQAPFHSGVDRAVVLSADPEIRDLLAGMEPVRSGVTISNGTDGINEEYVVTEGRVPAGLRTLAQDLLNRRVENLRRIGLDPIVSLRYDRLRMEELGVPAGTQRTFWSMRTEDPFKVANAVGTSLMGNEQDRWMGCLADPGDFHRTGFDHMAFAHGPDPQGRVQQFERLSGIPWTADPAGEGRLVPVKADADVLLEPMGGGLEHRLHVTARLTFEATGGPLRHALLTMPNESLPLAVREVSLSSADNPLVQVNLGAGLGRVVAGEAAGRDTETTHGSFGGVPTDAGLASVQGGSDPGALQLNHYEWVQDGAVVVFDRPIQEGEQVTLELSVLTRHDSSENASFGNYGTATEALSYLPRVQPIRPGERWDFETRVSTPSSGLRVRGLAASGTTVSETDNGDTQTLTVRGEGIRDPRVATGRWWVEADPAAGDLPAVRTYLSPDARRHLAVFGPEIRRQALWLQGFLPKEEMPEEIDVFQLVDIIPRAAYQQEGRIDELGGMVALQRSTPIFRGRAHAAQRPDFGSLGDSSELGIAIIEALGPANYTQVTANSSREVQNTYEVASEGNDIIPDRTDMADAGALRRADKHLAQRQLARQVAWQVVGEARDPASPREAWLPLALADSYAAFYLRSVYGIEDYNEYAERWRQTVETGDPYARWLSPTVRDRRFVSQTGATGLSDTDATVRANAGAYMVSEMLRFRMGDEAFFAALEDLVASGEPLSTDALEARTGPDTADFFDYFVHGGFVPALGLELDGAALAGGALTGCVSADLPYGRFDVPLVVLTTDQPPALHMVTVEDGVGRFDLSVVGSAPQVLLDPTGAVLAREREVREVDVPACGSESKAANARR